jgi:Zn-dependent peptidase ImmA (M78 family)
MQRNADLRNARKGKGLLPPNPKRWGHEHNGLDLRHELKLSLDECLHHEAAFDLLSDVHVLPHTQLQLMPAIASYFSGSKSGRWSGMCVPCPEGETMVIYNGHHPLRRIRATLMEEFFHLWLGHALTRLRLLSDGGARRDFDSDKESEAYGSGAAALVPYKPLRAMLEMGQAIQSIADHFLVSEQLVEFRIKVVKLSRVRR